MIFRKDEIKTEIIENNRGGEGKGEYASLIPVELLKDEVKFFNMIRLEPGASIGVHAHEGNYEVYIILEGEALIYDDGEEILCFPGDVNLCADGKTHGIKNTGEGPLSFMACIVYENKVEVGKTEK